MEVIERTNAVLGGAVSYLPEDDFRFKELLREAKASIPASPAVAHAAIACVYQLIGDATNARHHANNAIQLAPGNPDLYTNKSTILANLGYFSEAQEPFAKGSDPERGQMTQVWKKGYIKAAFQMMRQYLEKARLMKLDLAGLDTSTAETAARIMDKAGVTDADLGRMLDVAGEVLREHRLFYIGAAPQVLAIDEPGHDPFIQMTFGVALTPSAAVDLYMEFIERVTTTRENLPGILSVAFSGKGEHANERSAAGVA